MNARQPVKGAPEKAHVVSASAVSKPNMALRQNEFVGNCENFVNDNCKHCELGLFWKNTCKAQEKYFEQKRTCWQNSTASISKHIERQERKSNNTPCWEIAKTLYTTPPAYDIIEIETDNGKIEIYPDRMELFTGTAKQGYNKTKTEFFLLELKKAITQIANTNGGSVFGLSLADFKTATENELIEKNNGFWYPTQKAEFTQAEQEQKDKEMLNDWNNQERATRVFKRNGETVYTRDADTKKLIPITYTTPKENFSDVPDMATVSQVIQKNAEIINNWRQRVKNAWNSHKVKYDREQKKFKVVFENGDVKYYKPKALNFILSTLPQKPSKYKKPRMIETESTVNGVKLKYKINPDVWQPPISETISGMSREYYCSVCEKTIPKRETTLSKDKVPVRLCPDGHKCAHATEYELYLNQFQADEEHKSRKNANYSINENREFTEINTTDEEPIN